MASKVTYKIDLVKVFDRAYASKGSEVRSILRPLLSDATVKENIGREVVRAIADRTAKGKGKDDEKLGMYSEGYRKSTIFKIYKRGQTKVNLTLTGEMLSSMKANYAPRGKNIVIDFVDQFNNDKAHGQIYKNHYDFFGLPPEIEDKIVKEVINDASTAQRLKYIESLISGTQIDLQIGKQRIKLGGDEE